MWSGFRTGVTVIVMSAALGAAVCTAEIRWTGGFEASAGGVGRSTQGYLGVDIRDVSEDQVALLKLKESRGAEVIHVDHDGPAGQAGLRERDVILQMNGQSIEGEDQLRRILRETPAGRAVTLVISRDGQQQTLTTQMANRQEVERKAWEEHFRVPDPAQSGDGGSGAVPQSSGFFSPSPAAKVHNFIGALTPGSSYTGAIVETLGPQLAEFFGSEGAGVLVHSVDANSPAAVAGLRAGDVVLRANSVKMTNSSDWVKVIRENKGKSLAVVVLRDKKEQTLTLVPDGKKRSSVEGQPGIGGTAAPVVASQGGFSLRSK